jgi:hypothetical protein
MADIVAIDKDTAVNVDVRGIDTKAAGRPKPPPARFITKFCHPVAVMSI